MGDKIRFARDAQSGYNAIKGRKTVARIQRFQTKWIAWDSETSQAIRGPFGLGGSPFNTLADAKAMIRQRYEG